MAEVGGAIAEVVALLESDEVILRGAIRRRFARATLGDVRVDGDALHFAAAGEEVRLRLGPAAAAWASVLTRPPPSLRAKLGLDRGARALLVGACDDAALAAALDGVVDATGPMMIVARIDTPADLDAARAVITGHPELPIWAVYPKGKGFGDAEIRAALRAAGLRDTKSCAVSERLTATRYTPARGARADAHG